MWIALGLSIALPGTLLWLLWQVSTKLRRPELFDSGTVLVWLSLGVPFYLFVHLEQELNQDLPPALLLAAAGVILVLSLTGGMWAVYHVDRARRHTTWSAPQALRVMLGGSMLDFLPLAVLLGTLLALGPVVLRLPERYQMVIFLFWVCIIVAGTFTIYPELLRRLWRAHPMHQGEYRNLIEQTLKESGVAVADIMVLPFRGGRISNAMVSGILPTRRYVFLTDHLLERMTPQELRCIIAHELGHLRYGDLFSYLGFAVASTVLFSLVLSATGLLIEPTLLSVMVQGTILGLVATITFGRLSRRMEMRADLYALALTGDGKSLKSALSKLEGTLSRPNRVIPGPIRLLQTHPTLEERWAYIERAISR